MALSDLQPPRIDSLFCSLRHRQLATPLFLHRSLDRSSVLLSACRSPLPAVSLPSRIVRFAVLSPSCRHPFNQPGLAGSVHQHICPSSLVVSARVCRERVRSSSSRQMPRYHSIAPGEARVDEVARSQLIDPTDSIVRVQASGICRASSLHIFHGREDRPGLHDRSRYVGTVTCGPATTLRNVGRRRRGALAAFRAPCVRCYFFRRAGCTQGGRSRSLGAHGAASRFAAGHAADQGARAERRSACAQGAWRG